MKKWIAFFLAVLMLIMSVSCARGAADDTTIPGDITDLGADTTVEPENPVDDRLMKDDLGDDWDFNNEEFRIYSRVNTFFHGNWTVDGESLTGADILENVIFTRNSIISERFRVKFVEETAGNTTTAYNLVLANEDAYDIINTRNVHAFSYATAGILLPVENLKYIDLEKGYWDDNLNTAVTLAGIHYFPVGAANVTSYDFSHVLVFNKDMIDQKGLTVPYELVSNNEWTFDKFAELAVNGNQDDGDMVWTNSDSYGYLAQAKAVLPGFWIGGNELSIKKDVTTDMPELNILGNDNFITMFEKIFNITRDNDIWYYTTTQKNYDSELITMFQNNKGLFMDMTFYYIPNLRNMSADFGIIPYPKYNSAQENYYSRIEGCDLTCVPVTNSNLDRTSVILEAMACVSAEKVIPAYYEVALKARFSRDVQSAEMLDLIFNNRVFDLGDTIWGDELRDGLFRIMYQDNNRNIVSQVEGISESLSQTILTTADAFVEAAKNK